MRLNVGQPKVTYETNIRDIKIPKEMENAIPMNHPWLDVMFAGDGIIASTCTLVTGDAGAGKSTLCQQLADCLTAGDHIAVYFTGEESLYQLRRTYKRLKLEHGYIVNHEMEAQGIIEQLEALKDKHPKKHLFVFVDSLQCIRLRREEGKRGRAKSDEKQALEGLQMLISWCKNNWSQLFAVGQVTKGGIFAGKNTIKHAVDCHLHLGIKWNEETQMEDRELRMEKNRYGASGTFYEADMTGLGLKFRRNRAKANEGDFEDDED